jgi:geranylgeranyl diphosphate synthase, type I
MFTYLGWLCGAGESEAALRAAASTELLHAFALMQDDGMDRSVMRRGRPAAHVRLAEWYSTQNPAQDAAHFGESAAILLGELSRPRGQRDGNLWHVPGLTGGRRVRTRLPAGQ